MFAAAVALKAVVIMVSWHHVFPLLSTPKLEPVLEMRLSQPLCLLHKTGMLSFRFHCKTYFFDLSVPFQHI